MKWITVFFFLLTPLLTAHADKPQLSCQQLMARLIGPEEVPPLDPAKINYKIYGSENKETVILIHGLGGELQTWEKTAKKLSEKYKVITYDQRGHGQTPGIGENYSTNVMASDLEALMKHLHVEKASLVGHSMGARTAIRFAEAHPEKVKSLVFEDMHLVGRKSPLEDLRPLAAARKNALSKEFSTKKEATETFLKLFPYEPEEDDLRLIITKVNGKFRIDLPPTSYTHLYYANVPLQEDLTDALKGVKVPMLMLQADPQRGAVIWGKGLTHFQENAPNASVVGFPGIGHGIHHGAQQKYTETLEDFFAGKPLKSSPLYTEPNRH